MDTSIRLLFLLHTSTPEPSLVRRGPYTRTIDPAWRHTPRGDVRCTTAADRCHSASGTLSWAWFSHASGHQVLIVATAVSGSPEPNLAFSARISRARRAIRCCRCRRSKGPSPSAIGRRINAPTTSSYIHIDPIAPLPLSLLRNAPWLSCSPFRWHQPMTCRRGLGRA